MKTLYCLVKFHRIHYGSSKFLLFEILGKLSDYNNVKTSLHVMYLVKLLGTFAK